MIDTESALGHHLFEIAVAECVAQVSTVAEQNDPSLEMTPFERSLDVHEAGSSQSPE
jgi:hypothetical protein